MNTDGAILVHLRDSVEKATAFAGRTHSKPEVNYVMTVKQRLALVWAITQFRRYLYGKRCSVVTDHISLWCSANKMKRNIPTQQIRESCTAEKVRALLAPTNTIES